MTLVLHRFALSHFSEKARACLDFKGLDYRVEDHLPGLDQIRIVRLSGQRKLPVLEHDGTVIADSTEIGLYLERAFPETRSLLPADADRRNEVLALEDRLDRTLGAMAPLLLVVSDPDAAVIEAVKRSMSRPLAAIVTALAAGVRRARPLVPALAQQLDEAERVVRDTLAELTRRLETSKYLVGDEPSFADIAAVALVQPLRFPRSRYVVSPDLAGRAVTAVAEDPAYARFFAWRDQFYRDHLQ
ncbi:glutathione S-transferase [Sorangium sp. So ce1036]|uniref:glutathione S-transferase family protein n=1 Tax=Sorangium sp. So ce1036 TaxID=3133328 RepID=UPI003F0DDA6E